MRHKLPISSSIAILISLIAGFVYAQPIGHFSEPRLLGEGGVNQEPMPIGPTDPTIVRLPGRGPLRNPIGIGPDDLVIDDAGVMKVIKMDFELADEGNKAIDIVMLGGGQNDTQDGNSRVLFFQDPLDRAAAESRVAEETSEMKIATAAVSSEPFRWCAPLPGIISQCEGGSTRQIGPDISDPSFVSVADIGNAVVAAAGNPINLKEKFAIASTSGQWTQLNDILSSIPAPLAIFNKVPNSKRLKFSGYLSWHWPRVRAGEEATNEFYNFLLMNRVFPAALNLAAVLPIDLKGAASDKIADHLDNDLMAVFRLIVLARDALITDLANRPVVFSDGKHHIFDDLLGICGDPDAAEFVPLDGVIPDRNLSLGMFLKQTGSGNNFEGLKFDKGFFINAADDAAILTDTVGGIRKQTVLVASSETPGMFYQVDPDGPSLCIRRFDMPWDSGGGAAGGRPIRTPIVLPSAILIEGLPANFIPYQIRAANLDGDLCQDFVFTLRGAATIDDGAGGLMYDDGSGRAFSSRAVVVYREEMGDKCVVGTELVEGMKKTKMRVVEIDTSDQIAALTTGDLYGDGSPDDIVLGSKILLPDGKYSAGACIVRGPGLVSGFVLDLARPENGGYECVRVGTHAEADKSKVTGVSMLEAKHIPGEADGIWASVGEPLVFPKSTVAESPFMTYVSLIKDQIGNKLFYMDSAGSLGGLSERDACKVGGQALPLKGSDICCTDSCELPNGMAWLDACADFCAFYSKVSPQAGAFCESMRTETCGNLGPATSAAIRAPVFDLRALLLGTPISADYLGDASAIRAIEGQINDLISRPEVNLNPLIPMIGLAPIYMKGNL